MTCLTLTGLVFVFKLFYYCFITVLIYSVLNFYVLCTALWPTAKFLKCLINKAGMVWYGMVWNIIKLMQNRSLNLRNG